MAGLKCPFCVRPITPDVSLAHMSYCRKINCSKEPMVECEFNPMHVVPISERQFHKENCDCRSIALTPLVQDRLAGLTVRVESKTAIITTPTGGYKKTTDAEKKRIVATPIATFNALPPVQLRRLQNQTKPPAFQ